MIAIRLLSAGLIVTAVLMTPTVAHENHVAQRYVAPRTDESIDSRGRAIEGHARATGPLIRGFGISAFDAPGGICDHGDNPAVC
ncbi:hypothetical protein ACVMHW_004799 [Bradyrhizobium diazoefficiens]